MSPLDTTSPSTELAPTPARRRGDLPRGSSVVVPDQVGPDGEHRVDTRAETRFASLAAVRAVMITITAAAAALDPGLAATERARLTAVVGAWLLLLLLGEVARRRQVLDGLVGRASYLLDGVLITVATIVAGGTSSPLFFLAFVHVIAVTLMGAYFTGMKVAVWDSVLLLTAAAAETVGVFAFLEPGDPAQAAGAAIRGAALLVVAGTTAAGSALNERELRRSRVDLQQVLEVGEHLENAESVEAAALATLASATEDLGFEASAVVVHDGDLPLALARHVRGEAGECLPFDAIGAGVVTRMQPSLHTDWTSMPSDGLRVALDGREKLLVVPMLAGEVNGAMAVVVGRTGPSGIPARRIATVESLAHRLGRTVQRITLAAEVDRLASTDGLTGVANRRGFDQTYERLHTAARLRHEPLTVLLVDVDHFKAVNDTHGHQVGDEVLRAVAATIAGAVRDDDHVSRYGGEEFAVLLPATGAPEGSRVAERIRAAIEHMAGPVTVTASVGLATTPTHTKQASALLAASDGALYQAKRTGRNRVVVAEVGHAYTAVARRGGDTPEAVSSPAA